MSDDENFISRWSKRKTAARAGPVRPTADVVPSKEGIEAQKPAPPEPLPPVESLTHESDFTPFMKADVDPGLKRDALKTLFSDPRYNVMDGLDVYIDDYSKPDPLPPEWLAQMNQMKHLGAYLEEPEKPQPEASPGADSALQKTIEEQPVGEIAPDTGGENSTAVSVTESTKSGGTLPRNEA